MDRLKKAEIDYNEKRNSLNPHLKLAEDKNACIQANLKKGMSLEKAHEACGVKVGDKIRSKGKGRGLGRGQGKGPLGRPINK